MCARSYNVRAAYKRIFADYFLQLPRIKYQILKRIKTELLNGYFFSLIQVIEPWDQNPNCQSTSHK